MDNVTIKQRQSWVLRNPARTVNELKKLGYRADFQFGGQMVATVLSIDVFEKPVRWQAQVGLIDPKTKACKPFAEWTTNDLVAALEIAKQMLGNVGRPETDQARFDQLSATISRSLTAMEAGAVINAVNNRKAFKDSPIGEIGEFDFNDQSTRVDEFAFVSQKRSLIYGN